MVRICVQITDKMMTCNLDTLMEVHMELIQSLIKLTKNADLHIVIKSIQHLHTLMQHIADNSNKKEYKRILDCIIFIYHSTTKRNMDPSIIIPVRTLQRPQSGCPIPQYENPLLLVERFCWSIDSRVLEDDTQRSIFCIPHIKVIRPLFDEIQFSFQASS